MVRSRWFLAAMLVPLCTLRTAADAPTPAPVVLEVSYEGAIGPAAGEWLSSALKAAEESRAEALLIELDTPGGLLESTRLLVRDIAASPVPVIAYVAPSGARAASAGTFIVLACPVAAMAPGTRIGAAHPVELGRETQGDMRAKMENDAAAFIRGLAAERGRNAAWAEAAVRLSSSCTEQEALRLHVVDLVARDVPDLLAQADGRKVKTAAGERILHTRGAVVRKLELPFRVKFLRTITDPNIAYLLMMIGIYGILYEIIHPGVVLPGVLGGICLILGLYALQTLPVNAAGVALLLLAALLFAIETQVVSGVLAVGGVVSLILGSLLLIPREFPFFQVSRPLIFAVVLMTTVLFGAALAFLLRIRRARPVSGVEGMIGRTASAREALAPKGTVLFSGEIWQAEAAGEPIPPGAEVEVVAVEGLKLIVRRKTGEKP